MASKTLGPGSGLLASFNRLFCHAKHSLMKVWLLRPWVLGQDSWPHSTVYFVMPNHRQIKATAVHFARVLGYCDAAAPHPCSSVAVRLLLTQTITRFTLHGETRRCSRPATGKAKSREL